MLLLLVFRLQYLVPPPTLPFWSHVHYDPVVLMSYPNCAQSQGLYAIIHKPPKTLIKFEKCLGMESGRWFIQDIEAIFL